MPTPDWMTTSSSEDYSEARSLYLRPDLYKAESLDRWEVREHFTMASGLIQMQAVLIDRGVTITNLGFQIGNTAATTPTSWGFQIWTHEVPAQCTPLAFAASRNATTTITRTSGTFTETHVGRLITGTGITGGTYVTAQTSTTLTISAAASGSGSMTATLGDYLSFYPLNATADQTTTAVSANTSVVKALTTPFITPARGLYWFSFLMVATTPCTLVGAVPSGNLTNNFYAITPALVATKASQTFPGTARISSTGMAGMTANKNQTYCWAT